MATVFQFLHLLHLMHCSALFILFRIMLKVQNVSFDYVLKSSLYDEFTIKVFLSYGHRYTFYVTKPRTR